MITHIRRTAVALAVAGAAAGATVLGAGAAIANPSDAPCSSADVSVQVTKDPSHSAGHEAFLITYTAASPTTNCLLQGTPTGMSFADGDVPVPGVGVQPDAAQALPVNLTAAHPAQSRIIQATEAAPNPSVPTSVSFALPTPPVGQATQVAAAWPVGEPLKGGTVTVSPVSPADQLPTQVPPGSPGDTNGNGQLDSSETPDNPDQPMA
ncbi:DUF4232 domain-containing protein [Saccharopolyspora sp. NPDC050389]|uniref:DUF4232 domain-containing protein n=1 Tax=Saccharopolyspora sp. NPDC050389 TaxID=3155516 RepID=UPI0033F2B58C